jgi:hypothetical protein
MDPTDTSPQEIEKLFAAIPERNTGDCLLRTMQQHHVQLSSMADTKANIVITVSSIVLTLALGNLANPDLRAAMITLCVFTLLSLVLAIFAVLPKYRPMRLADGALPAHFNLLFFGHFSELRPERFLREISAAMKSDGSVYETMARDVYALGTYLRKYKYRYLRWSYLSFLSGFVAACGVEAWQLVFG